MGEKKTQLHHYSPRPPLPSPLSPPPFAPFPPLSGLEMHLRMDPQLPAYARGDSQRIRQVLLNLLENALKYTGNGGHITLTMLHRTSQWLQVSVCDSGPGIPIAEQQRIFLDRVRLPQTSSETSGFGVGLSVCRRIVEVHGGKIWVVSAPGEGACFFFTVPVWQGQDQAKSENDATSFLTEGPSEP